MSRFKVFTFYKSDGTKLPLYGTSVENALEGAGFSIEQIVNELKFCRSGMDDSLEFINGKWQKKQAPDIKVKIEQDEFNKN